MRRPITGLLLLAFGLCLVPRLMAQDAQKILDQTVQYIKDNKLDLADKFLAALEQMKSQLPSAYGSKIDAARKMFDTAKSGNSLLGGGTSAPK